mgnify:CR=1 FL=1
MHLNPNIRHAAILCALLLWTCSGCATVFNGDSQVVSISTTPPGAQVHDKDNALLCPSTPCDVQVKTDFGKSFRVSKKGYKPLQLQLFRQLEAGWIVADTFFWPSILVDAYTQAWYGLAPEKPQVVLAPVRPAAGQPTDSYVIAGPKNSGEARQNKEAQILLSSGLANGPGIGLAATLGLHISPDTLLEIQGRMAASAFAPGGLYGVIDLHAVAQVKHFLGNSFYLTAGGGVRELQGNFIIPEDYLLSSVIDEGFMRSRDFVLNTGIGNQWQWDMFTVGVEWVGLSIPVHNTQLTIDTIDREPNPPISFRRDAKAFLDDTTQLTFRLFNLNVGASF